MYDRLHSGFLFTLCLVLYQVQHSRCNMPELHCTLNYFITIIGLTHYSSSFISASTSVMSVIKQVKMSNLRTSNQGKKTVHKTSNLTVLPTVIQPTVLIKKADVCLLQLSVDKHTVR